MSSGRTQHCHRLTTKQCQHEKSQSQEKMRPTGAPAGLELWQGEGRLKPTPLRWRLSLPGPAALAVQAQGGRERMRGAGERGRGDGSSGEDGNIERHEENLGRDSHPGQKPGRISNHCVDLEKRDELG